MEIVWYNISAIEREQQKRKEEITMTMEQIMAGIKSMAQSQGLYGRLYESLMELNDEDFQEVKKDWESRNFKNFVDFVLFFEC